MIAEYVTGLINLSMLIELVHAIEKSDVSLSSDLQDIISDLSYLATLTDREMVHNILIDVLRKVSKS